MVVDDTTPSFDIGHQLETELCNRPGALTSSVLGTSGGTVRRD